MVRSDNNATTSFVRINLRMRKTDRRFRPLKFLADFRANQETPENRRKLNIWSQINTNLDDPDVSAIQAVGRKLIGKLMSC